MKHWNLILKHQAWAILPVWFADVMFTKAEQAPSTIIIPTEAANKKFIIAHHAHGNFPIYFQHPNTQLVILQPNESRWIFSDSQQLYSLQSTPPSLVPRLKTVAFANPLILDWSDADCIFVELTGDTTIQPINALPGQTVTLILKQDDVGNHQVIWGDNVRLSSEITVAVLTTSSNSHDKISLVYNDDGANYYDIIQWIKGFMAKNLPTISP